MNRLSTLDILKLLDGSNCKECGLATCMAFAALVYQGQRKLSDCTHLEQSETDQLAGKIGRQQQMDWTGEEALRNYKARLKGFDLASRATVLGGWMQGDRLAFHCLGKLFQLDPQGGLHSDCHQNPWLHVPMLSYILDGQGVEPSGKWVRFSELKSTHSWVRFFQHSCEARFQQLAEEDPELALDILSLFAAKTSIEGFEAQHTYLLYPLPLIPILFSFQPAEGDFPASLSVYLDSTADKNLDAESLFRLGRGMSEMFMRIAQRHGLGQ